MNRAILLAFAAELVAACAAPSELVDVPDMHTSQAAADIALWTAYRTFNFAPAAVDVSVSDTPKLTEIVAYLESNPSLDVGIDTTLGAEGNSEADRNLGARRAASLRLALMNAGGGVASYKIFTDAFAGPGSRHAGQIQVLVGPRTGSSKPAQ
jgi:hypothetical protein